MPKSKSLIVITVAVGLLALWWMLGRQATPETPVAAAPSETASAQPATVTVPATSTNPEASSGPTASGGPSSDPATTMSAKEQEKVAAFATRFMKAFARPSGRVSDRAWWERVASMLTDDAVDLYAGVTPDQVGFRKVTGSPELQPIADSDAFWIQPVIVPTDGGRYTLLVQLPSSGFSKELQVIEIQEP